MKKTALFACLLFLAVGWLVFDNLFMPFGERSVSVEIPDYCGLSVSELSDDARMELAIEYRYDARIPAGQVFSQTPAAGSRRKLTAAHPKCEVSLVVSLGKETVTVPEVMGRDGREMESLLREMGFVVTVSERESTNNTGTVLFVEPRAGTELPKGAEVVLTVSAGMPSESVSVPDVRGLMRSEALVRLWRAKLAVGEVIEVDSDQEGGTVIRQSHQGGTLVQAGTKITLYVAKEYFEE